MPLTMVTHKERSALRAINSTKSLINVSGNRNNCGLYALALAINHALHQQSADSALFEAIPEWICTLNPQDVFHPSQDDVIGQQMRTLLRLAIVQDAAFKMVSLHNDYIPACRYQNWPAEKEAFLKANQDQLKLYLAHYPTQEVIQSLVNTNPLILPFISNELKKQLTAQVVELLQFDAPETALKKLFDGLYHSSLNDLEHFSYAIASIRKLITDPQGYFFNTYIEWFLEQVIASTNSSDLLNRFSSDVIHFAKAHAFLYGQNDLENSLNALYWQVLLTTHWDALFGRYADYLETHPVTLSPEELNCLAKKNEN